MTIKNVRTQSPLVLTYANFVTPQFVANVVNVIGASPLMSREVSEFNDLCHIAHAVVINIGTLKANELSDIVTLSKVATNLDKPVILDPVAVAVPFRSKAVQTLMREGHVDIIRGNAAEIAWFADIDFDSQGIDATGSGDVIAIAQLAAEKTGAIIALSGAKDVISDGHQTAVIETDVPLLSTNVGTGDALSSMIGAFVAESLTMENVMYTMATFKLAGLKASHQITTPGFYSMQLLDELAAITSEEVATFMTESVQYL